MQQTQNLTSYQLNMLRQISLGVHNDFGTSPHLVRYPLGSKSNIDRLKKSFVKKDLISVTPEGLFITNRLFEHWFSRHML